MNKFLFLLFILLLLGFFSECTSVKKTKIANRKWAVAKVDIPKAKQHTTGKNKQTVHHISTISFNADSAGNKINIHEDYDAGAHSFFYYHTKARDEFMVEYDSLHPHKYKVHSNKPYIENPSRDSVIGNISKVFVDEGYVEFDYSPGDSSHHKKNILHRVQDIRYDSIKNSYPDIKKGSYFPVVFNKMDSTKARIIVFDNGKPKKTKEPETTGFLEKYIEKTQLRNAFVYVNVAPPALNRTTVGCLWFANTYVAAGMEASLFYKNLLMTKRSFNSQNGPYDYSTLNKNVFICDPYVRFNVVLSQNDMNPYDPVIPDYCMYFKASYSFTSQIDGLSASYYNKQGVKDHVTDNDFLAADPTNKIYREQTSFKTHGFTAVWGLWFALLFGSQTVPHFFLDLNGGYRLLVLPSSIKQNRVINNETYYYRDSPLFTNKIGILVTGQINLVYRF